MPMLPDELPAGRPLSRADFFLWWWPEFTASATCVSAGLLLWGPLAGGWPRCRCCPRPPRPVQLAGHARREAEQERLALAEPVDAEPILAVAESLDRAQDRAGPAMSRRRAVQRAARPGCRSAGHRRVRMLWDQGKRGRPSMIGRRTVHCGDQHERPDERQGAALARARAVHPFVTPCPWCVPGRRDPVVMPAALAGVVPGGSRPLDPPRQRHDPRHQFATVPVPPARPAPLEWCRGCGGSGGGAELIRPHDQPPPGRS